MDDLFGDWVYEVLGDNKKEGSVKFKVGDVVKCKPVDGWTIHDDMFEDGDGGAGYVPGMVFKIKDITTSGNYRVLWPEGGGDGIFDYAADLVTEESIQIKKGDRVSFEHGGKTIERSATYVDSAGVCTVSIGGQKLYISSDKIVAVNGVGTTEPKKVAEKNKPKVKRQLEVYVDKLKSGEMKENDILGQDEAMKMLQLAADANIPALLVGQTGTGKTTMVKHLAEENGKKWARFNLTGETTVDDFVGKYVLKGGETVWQDGLLLQAMKDGLWLVVDEINVALPEILFVLHSLLDDDKFVVVASDDGRVVRPHVDFRFFATMNPVDEYTGTKDLNKAFKSRFGVILDIGYPKPITEVEIVSGKGGVDKASAAKMVDVANAIREEKAADNVFYTCSTRDLIHWAKLYALCGDYQKAFDSSILNKADGDAEQLRNIYSNIFGKYDNQQAQGFSLNLDWLVDQELKFREEREAFLDTKRTTEEKVRKELLAKLES